MKSKRAKFDEGILRKKEVEEEEIEEAEEDIEEDEEETRTHITSISLKELMRVVVPCIFTFWFILFAFVAMSQAKTLWDGIVDVAKLATLALYTGFVWGVLEWIFE